MPTLTFTCDLNAPLEKVWAFHNTVESLFKLTPPDKHAHLEGAPVPMAKGVVYKIRVRQFNLIPIHMDSEIAEYTPSTGFVDVQVKGPFRSWRHQHHFERIDDTHTRLTDTVEYSMPFGPLGTLADRLFVRRDIERMFAYRHKITRQEVES